MKLFWKGNFLIDSFAAQTIVNLVIGKFNLLQVSTDPESSTLVICLIGLIFRVDSQKVETKLVKIFPIFPEFITGESLTSL